MGDYNNNLVPLIELQIWPLNFKVIGLLFQNNQL